MRPPVGLEGKGVRDDEAFVYRRVELGLERGEGVQRIKAQFLGNVGNDELPELRIAARIRRRENGHARNKEK